MAQVNVWQYAELQLGDGLIIPLGSKAKPVATSLTGSGSLYEVQKYNLSTLSTTVLFNGELSTIKWIAVKSTKDGILCWGTDATSSSSIKLIADTWQFFASGYTTDSSSTTIATRVAATPGYIADVSFYNSAATSADVHFIAVT